MPASAAGVRVRCCRLPLPRPPRHSRSSWDVVDHNLEGLHIAVDDAVATSSIRDHAASCSCPVSCVVKASHGPSIRCFRVQTIRKLSPVAFVLVEQDAARNEWTFLPGPLHGGARHGGAPTSAQRYAYIVGCEGVARMERHKRAD